MHSYAYNLTLGQGNVSTGVCLSTGKRGAGFPICITGHMTKGGSASSGVCIKGGLGKRAAGTHPTGIHSCFS